MRRVFFVPVFLIASLVPTHVCAEQVKLAWDAVSEPSVSGYRVYFSRENGRYNKDRMVDAGKATTCTINLDKGKWYIAVTAYDSKGNESACSNPVIWEKDTPYTPDALEKNPDARQQPGNKQLEQPNGASGKTLIPPSAHRDLQNDDGTRKLIPPNKAR